MVDQLVFLQFRDLFWVGGDVSLSGACYWPADTTRDSHPISNSCPCQQLISFTKSYSGDTNDAECLDVSRPPRILHRIAGSGNLSQSLRFKSDDLSNCPLQFAVAEYTSTLSHLDLFEGDAEDIVLGRRGTMLFGLISF